MSHAILPVKVVMESQRVPVSSAMMDYISLRMFVVMSVHRAHTLIKRPRSVLHVMAVAHFVLVLRSRSALFAWSDYSSIIPLALTLVQET